MRKFLSRIARFFSLPVWLQLPRGLVADTQGMWGLMALISNVNAGAPTQANVTTAGTDSALTAAEAVAGTLILATGASGAFTITLPSTAAIIAALGPTIPTDGTFSKIVRIKNDSVGQTGTLTAGDASTTITGTATIATATTRTFLLTVDTSTTVTFENLGSASL